MHREIKCMSCSTLLRTPVMLSLTLINVLYYNMKISLIKATNTFNEAHAICQIHVTSVAYSAVFMMPMLPVCCQQPKIDT